MTLAQNITRAITDFDNIAQAISDKGVAVPEGTPTSGLAGLVGQIAGGASWGSFTGTAAFSLQEGGMALGINDSSVGFDLNIQLQGLSAGGPARAIDFSNDGRWMAVGISQSPYVVIYRISGDTFTPMPNPSVLPAGIVNGVDFSSDSRILAIANQGSPFQTIYKIDGDNFNRISPDVNPYSEALCVRASSKLLAIGSQHSASLDMLRVYKIGSDDTITKLSASFSIPEYNIRSVALSPDGNYFAYVNSFDYSNWTDLYIYSISGDTFSPVKQIRLTGTVVRSIDFSPDGKFVACAGARLTVVKIDTEALITPSDNIPNTGNGVRFSPDGSLIAVAHNNTPFISLFAFDGAAATRLPGASTLPPNTGYAAAFNKAGSLLGVAHDTAPLFTVYARPPANRIYPTTGSALLNALVGPTALITGVNLMAVGTARETVSAGTETSMDVWIE